MDKSDYHPSGAIEQLHFTIPKFSNVGNSFLDEDYDISNYPWMFDPRSEEIYILRQMFTTGAGIQRGIYQKLNSLKSDAIELIHAIEKEIEE